MSSRDEIDELRETWLLWAKSFRVSKHVDSEDHEMAVTTEEQFVWSVCWDWDQEEAFMMPGYAAPATEVLGYYLGGRKWSESELSSDCLANESLALAFEDFGAQADVDNVYETCDGSDSSGEVMQLAS